MKGGESLGNEEGSEETSEEGSEEEVSPARIYTPGVRPLTSGVFLCPECTCRDHRLLLVSRKHCLWTCVVERVRLRETAPGEAVREKDVIPEWLPHVRR